MTNALKGALLSGLVLPGLGQISLKRYMRGLAIIMVVLGSLAVMVLKAFDLAYAIIEKMELESRGVDIQTITDAASRSVVASDSRMFNFCLVLIIVCWLFSIVDAYVIGRQMDARPAAEEVAE